MRRNAGGWRIGEDHGRAKHSDALVERARELREEGKSYRQIGIALGVSPWTARDWADYRTRA